MVKVDIEEERKVKVRIDEKFIELGSYKGTHERQSICGWSPMVWAGVCNCTLGLSMGTLTLTCPIMSLFV